MNQSFSGVDRVDVHTPTAQSPCFMSVESPEESHVQIEETQVMMSKLSTQNQSNVHGKMVNPNNS
jgi:hypothetical protein